MTASCNHLALALLLFCFHDQLVLAVPTTRATLASSKHLDSATADSEPKTANKRNGVIDDAMVNSMMKSEFSHQDKSMSVDELLKTLMFLSKTDSCKQDAITVPPTVVEVRNEFKSEQVIVIVQDEDNVVNYFLVYKGLGDDYNFALRSGKKTTLPLRNIPKDTVILAEIFALRRCMWQVFWSRSVYLEIKVSKDDQVTVVTPPKPTACPIPRSNMALEGKLSEDSMTFTMKPESRIDRYLVTMDTKSTRHQTYISNGPEGYGINGMTIGELAPASMYKITIIGEKECFNKAFHSAPIFFSAKTIGTRVVEDGDEEGYPTDIPSGDTTFY